MNTQAKKVAAAIVTSEKAYDELVDLLASTLSELDYESEVVNAFAKDVKKGFPAKFKPSVGMMVAACHEAGADRKVTYWFVGEKGLNICKDPSVIPHLDALYGKSNRQAKANAAKEEKSEAEALFELVTKRLEKMDKKQSAAFKKLIKAL